MRTTSRQRMIQSAALLMSEHGVEATSFSDVIARSGAPRGSIYHHFPGGKAQLIEEATRYTGDAMVASLTEALEQDDPVAALDGFAEWWRMVLRSSNFAAGCPVVAATVEGDRAPNARLAAGEVFKSWEQLRAEALERKGIESSRARSLGTLMVAAIEGAILLARAQRSLEPFDRVADELRVLLRDALQDVS